MATRMQQRRGTAQQWLSTNNSQGPVLNAGEIGWESDTNKFKIGDGVNHWVNLTYFTDAASALAAINAVIDAAPAALNTLNELAAAINDDPSFFTTIATNLSNHESDTTNVHGIADTSLLATKSYADTAEADAITAAGTEADTKIANAVAALTKSSVGLGNVDNTADADKPVSTATQTALDLKASKADPTFTGTVSGVTATHVGLGNVDNTSDANKPVSTATQTALDAKASNTDLSDHTSATINVHGIADTTALATQDYVTDAIANSTDEYPDMAGDGIAWNATDYQFDVDSTIARLESPTFTGIVSGITKSMVGLENVDNTSDADKPVSTATQTALDAKLALAGGTMTGDLSLAGTPTQALHAATKSYVDAVSEGLHIHASVVAATTANVAIATDLEPGDLVDGVTLAEGSRVLVKSQTNAAQNGIYVVQASGAALRASDFNEPLEVDGGDFIFVTGGDTHDNTGWVQTTTNVVTIGTDPIEFTQFSGAGTYLAGTGLELTDSLFSIDTATTVDISTAQTLTNKTISAASNTLTIATTDLTDVTATAAEVNVLDGITATTTELNYVDGVTSAIQTQLDAKAPLDSPTFTGTVTLPGAPQSANEAATKAYVDNIPSLSIQQTNTGGTAVESYTGITTLQFDEDSGFDVTNPSAGIAKVAMNSTFKYWEVDGNLELTAVGLDTVNFVSGEGITITADGETTPQSITMAIDTETTVDKTTAQTLTNKTLTSPSMTNPSIGINYVANNDGNPEVVWRDYYTVDVLTNTFVITTDTWRNFDSMMADATEIAGTSLNIYNISGLTDNSGNYPLISVVYAVGTDASEGATYTFDSSSNEFFNGTFEEFNDHFYIDYNAVGTVGDTLQYLVGLDTNISNALGNTIEFSEKGSNGGIAALSDKGTVLTITPNSNVGVGESNFADLSTGSFNTAVGSAALYLVTTGNANTSIGNSALANTTTGDSNIAIGVDALQNNTTGGSNIAIGKSAMWNAQELENNIAIGHYAGSDLSTGSDNIVIGHGSQASSDTSTHEITLGNNDITRFRIPGLGINWTSSNVPIALPSQSGENGKYLTTDGTDASWATVSSYSAPTLGSTSIASGATVTTVAGLTLTAPVINVAINQQQGPSYTLALSDNGKVIDYNGQAAPPTVTIPADSSVNFPIGAQITVVQTTNLQVTFAGEGGVTVGATPGLKLRTQWSSATAIKLASNSWVLIGDLSA